MAFRILNDEELSLLDDNKRKHYEDELDIYRQRIAFVEQLETHANGDIQPYEPKLESIAVIGEIEAKPFAKPEYVFTACDPVAKPDLQVNPFVMAEPINPVLPVFEKQPSVKAVRMKKVERTKPELPSIGKPFAPVKRLGTVERSRHNLPAAAKSEIKVKPYKQPDRNQPALPPVVKPLVSADLLIKPVGIDNSNIKAHMPKVSMPSAERHPVVALETAKHSVPDVSIKFAGLRSISRPELSDAQLSAPVKPNIKVNPFKKVEPVQTNLPERSDIAPVKAAFKKPELTNAELPAAVKPSVNIRSLGEIQPAAPSLPKLSKISIQSPNFGKPDLTIQTLPVMPGMSVEPKTFKPLELKNQSQAASVMPKMSVEPKTFKPLELKNQSQVAVAIPKMSVEPKTFKPLELKNQSQVAAAIPKVSVEPKAFKPLELNNQPQVAAITPPTISIKPFARINSKATGLPGRIVVEIPDAYEKLSDLLRTANE